MLRLCADSGPLAQLAEQRTFNPRVVGSSPTGPTNTQVWTVRPKTQTELDADTTNANTATLLTKASQALTVNGNYLDAAARRPRQPSGLAGVGCIFGGCSLLDSPSQVAACYSGPDVGSGRIGIFPFSAPKWSLGSMRDHLGRTLATPATLSANRRGSQGHLSRLLPTVPREH